METLDVVVGNTVDFFVDVDNLSDSPTETKIEIYRVKKYPDGLQDLIATFTPVQISGQTIQFTFDTDAMAPTPNVLYGRFFVNDAGKKINAYFKLKFAY
jgi:hypothetical protein